MRSNKPVKNPPIFTHEGAPAVRISNEKLLRRSVMSCMLWENEFYEDGVLIAERIADLAKDLPFEKVAAIAIEAREKMKLRHAPLWLACALAPRGEGAPMGDLLARIIQRADEIPEFLALYWRGGKKPLAKQVKRGLALAFQKFDEYQLAKYDRDGAVKLRDALFLCHAKPKDPEQEALWKRLADGEVATPDTWEVALSGGADKKETFERLMRERKLGALAFLRNLRNMIDAKVDEAQIRGYLETVDLQRVLPFRFIAAARHAPKIEDAIEAAMFRALAGVPKLAGKTVILVDNSGSMYGTKVSAKSDLDRSDAACALAILIREVCEQAVIVGFGNDCAIIPNRRGFALADAIKKGPGGGTDIDKAVARANSEGYDRLILLTDEQANRQVRDPLGKKAYCINVASAKNGIGYGVWTHIDGWSEAVLDYIRASEGLEAE